MNKISKEKKVMRMTLLFVILYMTSHITRTNYSAVISEMTAAEGMQKSLAALALTASAITYGFGQLISGFMGDKFNPKKLIFYGLLLTISMNLLIPFCGTPYQMAVVWGINGFAQAFMWPPLVKIMSSVFNDDEYKKACAKVSCGALIGTIVVYALAPICITIGGWRLTFILIACFAAIMAIVWLKKCPETSNKTTISNDTDNTNSGFGIKTIAIISVVMFVIVLQGIMRDGVATWMPSYISETFNLSNKIAILTNVVLPLFSIFTLELVSTIHRRFAKNEFLLIGIMFLIASVAAFVLYKITGVSAIASVFFAAILSGCMHGANWILTAMMPLYFAKYGRISLVSGLLNSCTYIGSAISGSGLALFSETCGWSATLLLWSGISILGCLICMLSVGIWKKFKES